jgi:PhnB protein
VSGKYRPMGLRDVIPYLITEKAGKLIEFIAIVFDADVLDCAETEDKKISNAILRVGDSIIEVADANEQWLPQPAALHVYVQDVDGVYERALQAGAASIFPPSDRDYGERMGGIKDPFGNQWFVATLI